MQHPCGISSAMSERVTNMSLVHDMGRLIPRTAFTKCSYGFDFQVAPHLQETCSMAFVLLCPKREENDGDWTNTAIHRVQPMLIRGCSYPAILGAIMDYTCWNKNRNCFGLRELIYIRQYFSGEPC